MRHIVHITGLWHHRLKTVKLFLEPICVRFRVAKSPFFGAQFTYRLYKEYGPEQYVQILQLIADTWNGAAWSVTGYLLGGVAVFLREYGEEYSRSRFIKRLRSATYETLRDEARRQQRGSSDVAHALAIAKLYNLTGGRGTVDPRRLTVLD